MNNRAEALFAGQCHVLWVRTDRMFAALMAIQWFFGIALTLVISPRDGDGQASGTQIWVAILAGGFVIGFPVALAWLRPGWWFTRHTVAVGQMLASAVLIHLTGGRLETRFHVFGSLAFLACYRDWRVLLTANVVLAADQFLRGVFWPESVYGFATAGPWRVVEHIGWVFFLDVVLVISIRQSLRDMSSAAAQQGRLADSYHHLEAIKQELLATNIILNSEMERRIEREEERRKLNLQLVATSRRVGMADVASSVLHNVGNVLNSVNISSNQIATALRRSSVGDVGRIAGLLREHERDLAVYLTGDPKGRRIPAYFQKLADALEGERSRSLTELELLITNVDHIKQIIAMQQGLARSGGLLEPVSPPELFEQALSINLASLDRHGIEVIREFAELPALVTDRHQVLQVLVNLISNAKYAMLDSDSPTKRLTLRALPDPSGPAFVLLQVSDTGMGIKAEHLGRVFTQGFTTKQDGHGFGLHSCALSAKAMGGVLEVHSDGDGCGANFSLRLPAQIQSLQTAA